MSGYTIVSREELYALVWANPMIRLGEQFGLSGNGLAKICRKLDVPYQPRGWWAKKAAGKKVVQTLLPKLKPGMPGAAQIIQRVGELETPRPEFDGLREQVGEIVLSDRLTRAHPIIAAWKAERQRLRSEASREREPWLRRAWSVPAGRGRTAQKETRRQSLATFPRTCRAHRTGATGACVDRRGPRDR